ncbi:B3 domain-containing protein REM9-like [Ipomoea triloba]|uniref:B3 domain-containing protein REM9-like n=1 Tax=Ipomoea triloba TaxID=35885 RepID=UPI00125D9127|nr:B3 domain-containing protein REM9-like [Ipomoea triloba]
MKVNPYPSFLKTYLGEAHYQQRIKIPGDFVKAHKKNLSERSWALKTEGNSEFEVLLYSQTTCCEISPPQPDEHTATESSEETEASGNAKKQKRKPIICGEYEARKKAKGSADTGHKNKTVKVEIISSTESERDEEEESPDSESEKEAAEGVRKARGSIFSTLNLNDKQPSFEIIVQKSHEFFMTVPIVFARHTGILHEKMIKLSYENGMPQKMAIASSGDRVRLINGWKSFCEANKIENGNRCSFTLLNPHTTETMVLLVKKLPKLGMN